MAANVITRTFVTAVAYAWTMTGTNDDGSPKMEKVGNVEFTSTKPNRTEAFRALKSAGVKCQKQFVGFDEVSETVYAMTVEKFMEIATPVTRGANGRIDMAQLGGDVEE